MRGEIMSLQESVEVRMKESLGVWEAELLKRAEKGDLSCPWCGRPLKGVVIHFELDDEDSYAGVRLSCRCGFVEY